MRLWVFGQSVLAKVIHGRFQVQGAVGSDVVVEVLVLRESGNQRLRTEFWSVHRSEFTIKAVNEALGRYLDDYYNVRPRQALGWLTPNQFRANLAMVA